MWWQRHDGEVRWVSLLSEEAGEAVPPLHPILQWIANADEWLDDRTFDWKDAVIIAALSALLQALVLRMAMLA